MPLLSAGSASRPGRRPSSLSSTGRGSTPRSLSNTKALALTALTLLTTSTSATSPPLPYTPTTILLPSDHNAGAGTAYIFTPRDNTPHAAVGFLALDISSLRASSLDPTTLSSSSSLPFLPPSQSDNPADNGCATFAPTLLRNGTIAVLAGQCGSTSSSASTLWTYTPGTDTEATWTQHSVTPAAAWDNAQSGPYALGGVVEFSPQLRPKLSDPIFYLYGGMCPSDSLGGEGTYSNRMLRFDPPAGARKDAAYTMGYATPKGQQLPVAEAGFTLTELTPSITNLTSGDDGDEDEQGGNGEGKGIITQQTTHVLLGGHTPTGFVNMSTAAVWSLPEETWNFVGIAPPSPNPDQPQGDLARHSKAHATDSRWKRDTVTTIDSRSGHTAVLSEDGTRLVVYGGWVGDVSQAARPQLAVVRMGVGLGDWVWEVPDLPEDTDTAGVYGHGAAVLPGNVMMVYGGFETGSGGEQEGQEGQGVKKREIGRGMFYNITSGRWADVYVSPQPGTGPSGPSGPSSGPGTSHGGEPGGDGSSGSPGSDSNGDNNSNSRTTQIALGVGLGVGALLLAVLGFFGLRCIRRRRQRRAARDATLRGLSQGFGGSGSQSLSHDEMAEQADHSPFFPWTATAAREWYTAGDDPYAQGRRSLGYETLRGAPGSPQSPGTRPSSLYIPPPPSASTFSHGRPKGAKRLHQPTYDFTPFPAAAARGAGRIEPIYEADEGDEDDDDDDDDDDDGETQRGYPLSPEREEMEIEDPFLTPVLHTPTGQQFPSQGTAPGQDDRGGQEQHPDVQHWVSDVDASSNPAVPVLNLPHPARRRSNSGGQFQPQQPHSPTMSAAANTVATAAAAVVGRLSSPLRRGLSNKSAQSTHQVPFFPSAPSSVAHTDDGRTVSSLSEQSALSFVRGGEGGSGNGSGSGSGNTGAEDRVLLSRLRSTLATTTTVSATTATVSVTGTGVVVNTTAATPSPARSKFAALRDEGPGLLLGRSNLSPNASPNLGAHDDGHYVDRAGSPVDRHESGYGNGYGNKDEDDDDNDFDFVSLPNHKSRPRRRSWLGSLKRVFSGSGIPDSSSSSSGNADNRGQSPTREGLLSSLYPGDNSPEYDGGLARQQKRRQGRGAWVDGDEDGDDEEWDRDLERAAEQRTVQIMFTVPREALRVVNAEVEREESVLIVDPEEVQETRDETKEESLIPSLDVSSSSSDQPEQPGQEHPQHQQDLTQQQDLIQHQDPAQQQAQQELTQLQDLIQHPPILPPPPAALSPPRTPSPQLRPTSRPSSRSSPKPSPKPSPPEPNTHSTPSTPSTPKPKTQTQPQTSTQDRTQNRNTRLRELERLGRADKIEQLERPDRPKSRVLRMVESFESRSPGPGSNPSSPGRSPERSPERS